MSRTTSISFRVKPCRPGPTSFRNREHRPPQVDERRKKQTKEPPKTFLPACTHKSRNNGACMPIAKGSENYGGLLTVLRRHALVALARSRSHAKYRMVLGGAHRHHDPPTPSPRRAASLNGRRLLYFLSFSQRIWYGTVRSAAYWYCSRCVRTRPAHPSVKRLGQP